MKLRNLFLLLTTILLAGCATITDMENRAAYGSGVPSKTHQILIDEGYTGIVYKDAAIFGCWEDDSFFASDHYTVTNVNGKQVDITVCCPIDFLWLAKWCTVRH